MSEHDLATGDVRTWDGLSPGNVMYVDGEPHLVEMMRTLRLDRTPIEVAPVGATLQQVTSVGPWLVALHANRRIVIGDHDFKRTIVTPFDVQQIAGDPTGRYVIATSPGQMLAWDVSHTLPKVSRVEQADHLAFVDASTLVSWTIGGTALRYQLRPDLVVADAMPVPESRLDGHERLDVMANGVMKIVAPDGRERLVPPVATDAVRVAPAGAGAVITASPRGAVDRVDLATGRAVRLFDLARAPVALASAGDWVVAADDGGRVTRRGPRGLETASVTVTTLVVEDGGEVALADDAELTFWLPGQSPRPVVRFDESITALSVLAPDRVAVRTFDGRLWSVGIDGDRRILFDPTALPLGPATTNVSRDGRLAVAAPAGSIAALLTAVPQPWTVAESVRVDALAVAPDGLHVLVGQQRDPAWTVLAFDTSVPVPSRGWVQGATNARVNPVGHDPLEWTPLPAQ